MKWLASLYCTVFSFDLVRCQFILLLIPFLCQPYIHYKDNMLYDSLLNLYQINPACFIIDCSQQGAKDLERRKLLSVSMDGPNVNRKFLELLQQEQAEQYGGAQLIVVGSCGLHTYT